MTRGTFRNLASFAIAFALVSAGVSPACKFISGAAQPSIAHADHAQHHGGSPKGAPKGGHGDHQKRGDACDFCIAFHVNKLIGGGVVYVTPPIRVRVSEPLIPTDAHKPARLAGAAEARAPPLSL